MKILARHDGYGLIEGGFRGKQYHCWYEVAYDLELLETKEKVIKQFGIAIFCKGLNNV